MKDVIVGNPLKIKEYGKKSGDAKQDDQINVNYVHPNNSSARWISGEWMSFCLLQLKEQKLQIQVQKLELEK